jgi:hypothetical protein
MTFEDSDRPEQLAAQHFIDPAAPPQSDLLFEEEFECWARCIGHIPSAQQSGVALHVA